MSFNISRIGIGTVQFGMSYGINNQTGQVPYDDVLRIFQRAAEHGINFVDTARGYGESEEVIGRALEETGLRTSFVVCTKLDLPQKAEDLSRRTLREETAKSVDESRSALGTDTLDVVLLHKPEYRRIGNGAVWERLLEFREKGVIERIGISATWGPEDLDPFFDDGITSVVQIPFNALDSRWNDYGVLDKAHDRGITTVNRSTLLQGLLVMTKKAVEERLPTASSIHSEWIDVCTEHGYEPLELAIRYVLSEFRIDSTILGVDSAAQFEEHVRYVSIEPLDSDLIDSIRRRFKGIPIEIVNPALWQGSKT